MGGDERRSCRLLTVGPDNAPLWVCVYVQKIGEAWAAMIVADKVEPPAPGERKGFGFFLETAEEAEQIAHSYLMAECVN